MIRLLLAFVLCLSVVQAKEVPFTLEDRDRLIRMEAELKALSKSVDTRFEEVNRKIDMLFNFLWIITGIFTTITVATIGFAIWDRRTTLKPFEDRIKDLDKRLEKGEDMDKKFLDALRTLAQRDKELTELLKKYNML